MRNGNAKGKFHYAWVVCIMGLITFFLAMGTMSNGFSMFLPYIMEVNGLTNTQTSAIVTMRCVTIFLSLLFIRYYYSKLSLRLGITLALMAGSLAFFIYSFATTYEMYLIGSAISGICYGLATMVPVSMLMNRWFVKSRGLSLGIVSAGSGIATIILPPVATALVEKYSLSTAFRIEAIGIFALASIIGLLIRNYPADKGLLPYGVTEETKTEDAGSYTMTDKGGRGLSRTEWALMCCIMIAIGVTSNAGFAHISVLYTSQGYSNMFYALVASGIGITMTFTKIFLGSVVDRIGGYKASMWFMPCLILGSAFCCLTFIKAAIVSVMLVLSLGFGYAIAAIGPSVWANDMVSPSKYSATMSHLQMLYAGGALAFSVVPGKLADVTGSYIPAYVIFTALMLMATVFLSIAYKKNTARRAEEKQ